MRPTYRLFGSLRTPAEQIFSTRECNARTTRCLDDVALRCHIATMTTISNVCVYCGSSPGTNPRFVEAATDFGKILAENKINLVYGGGSFGLMGALATSVLDHGGTVTGIIPEVAGGAGACAEAGPGDGGDPRHARTQAADVRALGCLRRPARRHRHAGGTGRAAHLGAARASQKADRACAASTSSGIRCSKPLRG